MSERKRHNIYSLRELYDYILNRKDMHSRHHMEKEMQQDPFLEDAMEGFSELDEDDAKKLVADLNARIGKKSEIHTRNWITGMAATIALLIIAGIGYMAVRWVDHSYNKAKFTLEQPVPDDDVNLQPLPEQKNIIAEPEITIPAPATETYQPERSRIVPSPAQKSETEQFTEDEIVFEDEDLVMEIIIQEEALAEEIQIMPSAGAINQQAPRMAISQIQNPSENLISNIIKGKVVDSESGESLPGVTIMITGTRKGTVTDMEGNFEIEIPEGIDVKLTASFIGMVTEEFSAREIHNDVLAMQADIASLSEVVVIGYGRSGRSAAQTQEIENSEQAIRIDPQPIGGYRKLNEYLKKNAIIAESETVNRITIILRFEIDRDGNPVTFEIVESKYDDYAQRAEKLITDGPRWIPAKLNGQFIKEPVELKITFRK